MKKIFLLLVLISVLWACNDHEDEDYNVSVNFATVENPDQETSFAFILDDNTRLWTLSSSIPYYRPKNGQRVILSYRILSNRAMGNEFKHDIRIEDVYEVLTKGVFKITPETEDSIGNDEIRVNRMWIGNDFLNVQFEYPGYNRIHYINLVSDESNSYNDGKIHLEFRHNANSDLPWANRWGYVSFNLKSLQKSDKSPVDIVVHTNEYSYGHQVYNLKYEYTNRNSISQAIQMKTNLDKAIIE